MKQTGYDSITSWCVSLGCSFIVMTSFIGYRLSGLFYVIFIEHFDISREKASYPIVTFVLVRTLGAPIIGILGEKFGVDEVTLLGTILVAIGFGGCYFVNGLAGVIFFIGIIYGIGLCGSTAMTAVVIKKHFTRNIITANGITLAGSCVGAFTFPALAIYLLEKYGVSGTFLITSGIMLNSVPVAMLIISAGRILTELNVSENIHKIKYNSKNESNKFSAIMMRENSSRETKQKSSCATNNICGVFLQDKLKSTSLKSLDKTESTILHENTSNTFNSPQKQYYVENCSSTNLSILVDKQVKHSRVESDQKISISLKEIETPKVLDKSKEFIELQKKEGTKISKNEKIYRSLKIFVEPKFLLIALGIGIHTYVMLLYLTTMIDYSRDKGISRNYEVYILTFLALFELIGRLGLGWVTDHGYMTLLNFMILCYCLLGLSFGLFLWCTGLKIMFMSTLFFGISSGALLSCSPGLIYKFIEADKQTMALTSRQSLFGVFVCTSSPLIGFFRENLGSYDGLYYLFIALCIMCCVVILLLQRVSQQK